MNNFNLRKFVTENKLTDNSRVLAEQEQGEASNKELLLELVDNFKSGLESTDDSEYNESISEAWCDDAVTEIMELKDYFVSKQSREDISEEDITEPINSKEEVKLIDKVDMDSLEIGDVDTADWPKFTDAYIEAATFQDGTPLTDDQLDQLTDELYQDGRISDLAYQSLLEGKTKKEQKLIKEVLKTIQKSEINEASYFDRYGSKAAIKVGQQLTSIVDIFSKNADQEAQEINQAIEKEEVETGTTVTPIEKRALLNHADWIRTLAYRMER